MTATGWRLRGTLAVCAALATAGVAGCTDGALSSKAGEGALPQSFVLAVAERSGRPVSDDALEFARLVHEISGGAITVEVSFEGDRSNPGSDLGADVPTVNADVTTMVTAGEVELALVPDWTWISLGAERLTALKAPFLVTDDRLANRIALAPVAADMLAELRGLDVHGLALLPETIRHPVSFDRPFQRLGDFEGSTMRALDTGVAALLGQLGATTVASDGGEYAQQVADGLVDGADSAFAHFVSLPRPGTYTGDVGYAAKMNTLVAGGGWFDSLDHSTRTIITTAARRTLDYVIETNPSDAESARAFCERGGTVVNAGADALAEIRAAALPLRADYERSERTRDSIALIEGLAEGVEASDVVVPCQPAGAEPPPPSAKAPGQGFPEGTFRAELTVDQFLEGGVDRGTAIDHAGLWTMTFRDGAVHDLDCPGSTYSVKNGRLSLVLGSSGAGCGTVAGAELFSAAWTFDGQVLRFIDVRSGADGPLWQPFHEVLWGGQPWTLVG
ncbi:MAG: hypothetical protein ABWY23_04725 [Mycetocola sp.]